MLMGGPSVDAKVIILGVGVLPAGKEDEEDDEDDVEEECPAGSRPAEAAEVDEAAGGEEDG
jgi:hypothetical protein